MAGPKRKTYTAEYTLSAVKMITDQKWSVAEVARRLGVTENRLLEWDRVHARKGADAAPGPENRPYSNRRISGSGPRSRGPKRSATSEKSNGVFRQPAEQIFAGIEECKGQLAVSWMCRVLGVPAPATTPGARTPRATEVRREERAAEVKSIHAELKARYGSPRAHAERVAEGTRAASTSWPE
ncbi:Transposase [Gemmata obscuriglobus]|nr:Transposase [Gemmata obscuriglobus]VTS08699.1 transposase is3 is911 family protein : Transposase IS3/IS911 family protein OS=Burkholderia ambifaria MEX-5 GN=BamMEX5DRAFT_1812 PE=4 SV=1: HTH_Tnp_1 [Gemmata obscuriglobus UQM 2246]